MASLLARVSPKYRTKLLRRVLGRIAKGESCWIWTGGVGEAPNNYGYTYVRGKFTGAHRLVYALCVADFDESRWVLHRCDNPQCVNPKHLFLGDNQANANDRAIKERGTRKLSIESAERIIVENIEGATLDALASKYGVSKASIQDIVEGRSYKNAPSSGAPRNKNSAKGSGNANARLNESQVASIKGMLRKKVPLTTIAKRYGVWASTIASIRDGKTWRQVC